MIDANPYFHEMSDWQAVGFNDVWQSCTNFWLFQLHQTGLLQHTIRFTIDSSCIVNWNFYDPAWSMEEKLVSLAEQSFWVDYDTTLGPSPRWLGWVPERDADTPPSKQQELKAMTLIACHFKHVTIWLFLCLKTKPLAFPATGKEFSDREDREDMIRVLKKLLDHDSPGVPEPSSNDDHDGACPDAYLMRTPFKVWWFFRGKSGWSFSRWRLASKETFWWQFWGPAFHYAGTGAYLVKAGGGREIWEMLGTHRPHIFDGFGLWPYYVPCCVPCWFGQGCYKVISKCRSWERSQQRPPSK